MRKRRGKCQGLMSASSVTWCRPAQEQLKDQLCEGQVMKNPPVSRGAPSLGTQMRSSAASCCHLQGLGLWETEERAMLGHGPAAPEEPACAPTLVACASSWSGRSQGCLALQWLCLICQGCSEESP